MQALPDRSEFLTVTLVVRQPGATWTAAEAADTDPAALVRDLRDGEILFGSVQAGITDAAIDAGADPTSWPTPTR